MRNNAIMLRDMAQTIRQMVFVIATLHGTSVAGYKSYE